MEEFGKHAWRFLCAAAEQVPFVGRLDYSNVNAIGRAAVETIISVVLSSIPIWVAIFVLRLSNTEPTLGLATQYVVRSGELMLLSAGAVAPMIYVVSVVYRSTDKRFLISSFPHGSFYLLFAIVVLVLSTALLTVRATETHPANGGHEFDTGVFTTFSFWCYVLSVLIFFTAAIHKNTLEAADPLRLNKDSEESFGEEWKNRP